MEYLSIGSAPTNERCAQIGHEDFAFKAWAECRVYKDQLRRVYGEPANGYFAIKSFEHEFGRYYEVIARFDVNDEEAVNWAYSAEAGLSTWDQHSRIMLLTY